MAEGLRHLALHALKLTSPQEKCAATSAIELTKIPRLTLEQIEQSLQEPGSLPGIPQRPELVNATQVKHRSMATVQGRAALIHALAHIELNAVNIALDAIWRFAHLPEAYYQDWLKVAHDEARHFLLLEEHLQTLGFQYGDFPAHNGLWDMAEQTKHDVMVRMALVPRTLEARGLDASPQVQTKLISGGDLRGAEIVGVILADEVGHVLVGNRWYYWLCDQRGMEPIATFTQLAKQFNAPRLIPPLNIIGRLKAGFTQKELELFELQMTSAKEKTP
jgi:uncharacterized ferritin-like protein (DUF455 family)